MLARSAGGGSTPLPTHQQQQLKMPAWDKVNHLALVHGHEGAGGRWPRRRSARLWDCARQHWIACTRDDDLDAGRMKIEMTRFGQDGIYQAMGFGLKNQSKSAIDTLYYYPAWCELPLLEIRNHIHVN